MSFKAAQDSFQLSCTAYLRCSTAFSGFISIKYKPNTVLFLLLVIASAYLTGFFSNFFSPFFFLNCYPSALEEMQCMSTAALIASVKVILTYICI